MPELPLTLDPYSESVTLISGNKDNEFLNIYKSVLGKREVRYVPNVSQFFQEFSKKNPLLAKLNYIVGASFTDKALTAWFNGDAFHSAGISFGLVLNTLFKWVLGQDYDIEFINYPIPSKTYDKVEI